MALEKNGVHYTVGILLFVLLKVAYTQMSVNDLLVILAPTAKTVAFLTNSKEVFLGGLGYFYPGLNILIERSCSGFNFLILSFIIGHFTVVNHFESNKLKWLLILPVFFLAWALTLVANTSRIIVSIFLSTMTKPPTEVAKWIHEAEGTFVYLSFLILFYNSLNNLIRYLPKYETFA